MFDHGLLNFGGAIGLKAFKRDNAFAFHFNGKGDAGADRQSINENGTGTAFSNTATEFWGW